jgi:hypothetical protein
VVAKTPQPKAQPDLFSSIEGALPNYVSYAVMSHAACHWCIMMGTHRHDACAAAEVCVQAWLLLEGLVGLREGVRQRRLKGRGLQGEGNGGRGESDKGNRGQRDTFVSDSGLDI